MQELIYEKAEADASNPAPNSDPPQVLHNKKPKPDNEAKAELASGKAELMMGNEEGIYNGARDEDTSEAGNPTTDELNR